MRQADVGAGHPPTEKEIERARGILLSVPDLDKADFVKRRRLAMMKFVFWLALTLAAALFLHPALLLVGVVVGWFVLDAGVFTTYKRSRRDLDWAKEVFAETGAELEVW